MKKRSFISFLILSLLLFASASAAIPDVPELSPVPGTCLDESAQLPLYAGPTVQYMEIEGTYLDPSRPYVCFGQSDSWTMAAQGTPDQFGPVGWVETAAVQGSAEPELSFADRLPAMVEEDTLLAFAPDGMASDISWTLSRGTSIQILGRIGDMLYVEAEADDAVFRGFIPESSVE